MKGSAVNKQILHQKKIRRAKICSLDLTMLSFDQRSQTGEIITDDKEIKQKASSFKTLLCLLFRA